MIFIILNIFILNAQFYSVFVMYRNGTGSKVKYLPIKTYCEGFLANFLNIFMAWEFVFRVKNPTLKFL